MRAKSVYEVRELQGEPFQRHTWAHLYWAVSTHMSVRVVDHKRYQLARRPPLLNNAVFLF